MIGNALKKLANENGMTVSNGVAYGSLRGYAATLSEGGGWKRIDFSVRFSDAVKKTEFMDAVGSLTDQQLYKLYRVNRLAISERIIQVWFQDNPGTMNKLMAFLDWFIPYLDTYGASKADFCAECGLEITEGNWIMADGICHHVHGACGEKIRRQIEEGNQREKEERTGSYVTGAVGAFLGAVLGAIVWAVILYIGYIASLGGLVIGFLAEKGYSILKGKQGKGKIVILIFAILFGVLLGTFLPDMFVLVGMINSGELPGATLGDIPLIIFYTLLGDGEYLRAVLANIGAGALFAGLGAFAMLRRTSKEVADTKFIELS